VFLTRADAFTTAQRLVIDVQVAFLSLLYDAFQVPASQRRYSVGDPASTAQLSGNETLALAVLVALLLYFTYSMYLGARLNHQAGVTSAAVSLLAVGLSPLLYATALIVFPGGAFL
jgi:hypothetical protein